MNISLVIPNFNGSELLRKNLPKVFASLDNFSKESVEVIVVDDCSVDESKEILSNFKSKYMNLKVFANINNLGFSSTINKGVSEATGDIVILLNSDVAPETDFLNPLLEHFKDEKVFAVGAMDKSIENGKIILRGRGLGQWKRGFLIHKRGEVDKTNTLWVSAGSGAFKKQIWNKLGGLNELYNPFYWEDIDISYRALKSGYKILFEPKSIVIHEHEKGSIKTKYSDSQIKRIAYKNQFIFSWINATDYSIKLDIILWFPYHLLKAALRIDLNFFLGFFNALITVPKVIESSSKYKKLFIKKDSEIISSYK